MNDKIATLYDWALDWVMGEMGLKNWQDKRMVEAGHMAQRLKDAVRERNNYVGDEKAQLRQELEEARDRYAKIYRQFGGQEERIRELTDDLKEAQGYIGDALNLELTLDYLREIAIPALDRRIEELEGAGDRVIRWFGVSDGQQGLKMAIKDLLHALQRKAAKG